MDPSSLKIGQYAPPYSLLPPSILVKIFKGFELFIAIPEDRNSQCDIGTVWPEVSNFFIMNLRGRNAWVGGNRRKKTHRHTIGLGAHLI